MTTQTLTFYGETGGQALDGFAGFRVGKTYQISYSDEGDEVVVQIPHAPGKQMRVSKAGFEKWFRK